MLNDICGTAFVRHHVAAGIDEPTSDTKSSKNSLVPWGKLSIPAISPHNRNGVGGCQLVIIFQERRVRGCIVDDDDAAIACAQKPIELFL